MVWSLGHTGIGFYTYSRDRDAAWFVSTGDYDMVYAGYGVVTSKRWEAVRDGIEDYSMLHLLRQKVEAAEAWGRHPAEVAKARNLLEQDALTIGNYCNWDADGTVPGKSGMAGAREVADRRWQTIQETRRKMAALLSALRE